MRVGFWILVLSLIISGVAGASGNSWSVFVFVDSESELKAYAENDIHAIVDETLRRGPGGPEVFIEIISPARNHGQRIWVTTRNGNAKVNVGLVRASIEDADPESRLRHFLNWASKRATRERRLLVLWGHGRGWRLTSAMTTSLDGGHLSAGSDDSLRSSKISKILKKFPSFDVLAFDACLMQTVEVNEEFAGAVHYIVGSEQIAPFSNLPYAQIIRFIRSIDPAPAALAAAIPWLAERHPRDPATKAWYTLSALSVDEVHHGFVPALANLSTELRAIIQERSTSAVRLQRAIERTPRFLGGYKDIGNFLNELAREFTDSDRLTAQINLVRTALSRAVLRTVAGRLYEPDGLSGVSVWMPETKDEFYLRRDDFEKSIFYGESHWALWIDQLFGPIL